MASQDKAVRNNLPDKTPQRKKEVCEYENWLAAEDNAKLAILVKNDQ